MSLSLLPDRVYARLSISETLILEDDSIPPQRDMLGVRMFLKKRSSSTWTALLLLSGLLLVGLHSPIIGIVNQAHATGATILGIDCGLGTAGLADTTGDGVPDADGTLETSCMWAGDADGDGVSDPLLSDNPAFFPSGTGGGWTAEIRVTGLPAAGITGFDISLRYNTVYLDAVLIDQAGLPFDGSFSLASTIDRGTGALRL